MDTVSSFEGSELPVQEMKSRLLCLPTELRLKIYLMVTTPLRLHVDFSQYAGLFLSCKQIYQEMEHEAVRAMDVFLCTLKQTSPPLDFIQEYSPNAGNVSLVPTLKVRLPKSAFPGYNGLEWSMSMAERRLDDILRSPDFQNIPRIHCRPDHSKNDNPGPLLVLRILLRLHLKHLNISLYEDEAHTENEMVGWGRYRHAVVLPILRTFGPFSASYNLTELHSFISCCAILSLDFEKPIETREAALTWRDVAVTCNRRLYTTEFPGLRLTASKRSISSIKILRKFKGLGGGDLHYAEYRKKEAGWPPNIGFKSTV